MIFFISDSVGRDLIIFIYKKFKKDINKDKIIKINDVEINLSKEVVKARDYQYNLIN